MKEKKKLMIAIALVVLLGILIFAIVKSGSGNSVTVTFESHGGTEVETLKIKKGETASEPEQPLKEGYEFIGWYYDGKKFDFTTELDKNIKLEAKWLKVGTIKNTVTFDSTGGSEVEAQKVTNGEKVKKPTNPTRSGYTFVTWTLDGKTYDFDTKVEKNITLVAVWKQNEVAVKPTVSTNSTGAKPTKPVAKPVVTKKTYKVNFYNDSTKITSIEVEAGKTVKAPAEPTKKNYIFNGWQADGTVYDFSTPVTKDINIYAIWKPVLNEVELISADKLANRTATNQIAVGVTKGINQITITKKAPLTSISYDGKVTQSNWVALSLDLGVRPTSVEVNSEAVSLAENTGEAIAIIDEELTQEDTTDFIVWVDVDAYKEAKTLTFKKADEVIGTVIVDADYVALGLHKVNTLSSTDTTDLEYNNQSIRVSSTGNVITVNETRFLKGPNNTTVGQYGIVLDLNVNPKYITTDGTMDTTEATRTKYQLSENEFVLWLENDVTEKTITFTNGIENTDTVELTVKFVPVTGYGIEYVAEGTIAITTPNVNVTYYKERNAFVVEDDIESFTFTDTLADGTVKSKSVSKQNGSWEII